MFIRRNSICRSKQEELTLAKAQRSQRMDENEIGKEVVDAAIIVHRELGPGRASLGRRLLGDPGVLARKNPD